MIRKLVLLVGGLVAVAIVAVAGWFFFLREEGPDEVSTDAALESLNRQTPQATVAGTTASGTTSASTPGTDGGSDLEGTWQIDNSLETFVGYRVQEELVSVGGVEAVGRTSGVTGSFTIAGDQATEGTITADMTALRSQESSRDGQLRTQGIEYGTYPTSEFTLTQPVDLPAELVDGETVSVTLAGQLTLHGVTRDVEVPAEVTLQNGVLVVVGQIDILFADYEIEKPRSQRVLGIEDGGVMELQLFFRKS